MHIGPLLYKWQVRKDIEPEEGYNSEFHLEMDQPQDSEKEMLSSMISQ